MKRSDMLKRDLQGVLERRGVEDAAKISSRLVERVYREMIAEVADEISTANRMADAHMEESRRRAYDIAAYRAALNQIYRGDEDPKGIAWEALTRNTRLDQK